MPVSTTVTCPWWIAAWTPDRGAWWWLCWMVLYLKRLVRRGGVLQLEAATPATHPWTCDVAVMCSSGVWRFMLSMPWHSHPARMGMSGAAGCPIQMWGQLRRSNT